MLYQSENGAIYTLSHCESLKVLHWGNVLYKLSYDMWIIQQDDIFILQHNETSKILDINLRAKYVRIGSAIDQNWIASCRDGECQIYTNDHRSHVFTYDGKSITVTHDSKMYILGEPRSMYVGNKRTYEVIFVRSSKNGRKTMKKVILPDCSTVHKYCRVNKIKCIAQLPNCNLLCIINDKCCIGVSHHSLYSSYRNVYDNYYIEGNNYFTYKGDKTYLNGCVFDVNTGSNTKSARNC